LDVGFSSPQKPGWQKTGFLKSIPSPLCVSLLQKRNPVGKKPGFLNQYLRQNEKCLKGRLCGPPWNPTSSSGSTEVRTTYKKIGEGIVKSNDVALRLGMWLNLEPAVVYLHRGSSKGAEKLNIKGKTVPLSAFPQEIQELGATHAENFLCIYKDRLG
jgi:hypothetical protein